MIFSSVRFLGRLGLLRGHYNTNDDMENGEINSIFMQLLKLRAEENPRILKFISKNKKLVGTVFSFIVMKPWKFTEPRMNRMFVAGFKIFLET